MHFIFLENSIDFTASSLNLKAIDSFQRSLVHFSKALVKRNHKVTIYNNTSINKSEDGIDWINISEISNRLADPDVFIICNDIDFLDITINAKLKLFWINSNINTNNHKSILIKLLRNKFIFLYNSDNLISDLPNNFKYIPKIQFKIGVSNGFFKDQNFNINNCCALVTTHPLKGLDWILDIWVNIISLKIPWAEIHIYSHILFKKSFDNNAKINNLKLKLFKYKNNGIHIKKPQPENEFIKNLSNYRVHVNPSNDISSFPFSIIESQAKGLPIISRENSVIYDYVYHNETGFITNDPNNFAKKTIDLLSDNSLFIRMHNNAKLNNKIYDWKTVVESFEKKIYENIVHR